MRATRPATRPAYSFFQLRAHSLDVLHSGFRLLDGDNPADPFIAGERGNVLPLCQRGGVGNQGFSQIRWQAMDHACGELCCHGITLRSLSESSWFVLCVRIEAGASEKFRGE